MNELAATDVAEWLSGALIGHEVRAALAWAQERGMHEARTIVIGAEAIANRYVRTLGHAGVNAVSGPAHAAAHGLYRVARFAGLIR
jgi:2-dehydro-3-deoxygalactonokinase